MANSRRDEINVHGDISGDKEEFVGSQRGDRLLQQRMHVRENRTPLPSQSSSSKGEQSYWRRSKNLPSESFTTSSHSVGGERHSRRRARNSPPVSNLSVTFFKSY